MHSANVMGALFSGTATVAAGMFTTLIVLFYLLVSGETFLRRFVEILPSFAEKRQAVEITLRHRAQHLRLSDHGHADQLSSSAC